MKIRSIAQLGLALKQRRTELGLSQVELAETVGVSRQWIGKLEKGSERTEVALVLRTLSALQLELTLTAAGEQTERPTAGSARISLDALIERAKGKGS